MLQLNNLSKRFGNLEVLKNLSMTVKKGEVVTIIGPSGSGKSTLLRCINCLEVPEKGTMSINNNTWDFSNLRKGDIYKIREYSSMVFQQYNLFRNKTVLENITEGLIYVQKKSLDEANAIAYKTLEQVKMLDKINEYPSRLSGGQQQRVGIARAIALDSELILFDEPTSSLDPQLVNGVLDIIRNLSKQDFTMIIVTHEMEFAKKISDKIIYIDEGRVIEQNTPVELFNNPKNDKMKSFLEKLV